MWRCVEKPTKGYCKGIPEWETEPIDIMEQIREKIESSGASYSPTMGNGKCQLQPGTCGRFVTISELNAMMHVPIIEHEVIEIPQPQQNKPAKKVNKPQQVEQETIFKLF